MESLTSAKIIEDNEETAIQLQITPELCQSAVEKEPCSSAFPSPEPSTRTENSPSSASRSMRQRKPTTMFDYRFQAVCTCDGWQKRKQQMGELDYLAYTRHLNRVHGRNVEVKKTAKQKAREKKLRAKAQEQRRKEREMKRQREEKRRKKIWRELEKKLRMPCLKRSAHTVRNVSCKRMELNVKEELEYDEYYKLEEKLQMEVTPTLTPTIFDSNPVTLGMCAYCTGVIASDHPDDDEVKHEVDDAEFGQEDECGLSTKALEKMLDDGYAMVKEELEEYEETASVKDGLINWNDVQVKEEAREEHEEDMSNISNELMDNIRCDHCACAKGTMERRFACRHPVCCPSCHAIGRCNTFEAVHLQFCLDPTLPPENRCGICNSGFASPELKLKHVQRHPPAKYVVFVRSNRAYHSVSEPPM